MKKKLCHDCISKDTALSSLRHEKEKMHARAVNAELAYEELAKKRPYDCYWSRRALAAESKLQTL